MRPVRRAGRAIGPVICLFLALPLGTAIANPTIASLPPDFDIRFLAICMQRGLSEDRCRCMTDVALREVADEHLALMLDHFENPDGFDSRALIELDNDPKRLQALSDEMAAAQSAARSECAG